MKGHEEKRKISQLSDDNSRSKSEIYATNASCNVKKAHNRHKTMNRNGKEKLTVIRP